MWSMTVLPATATDRTVRVSGDEVHLEVGLSEPSQGFVGRDERDRSGGGFLSLEPLSPINIHLFTFTFTITIPIPIPIPIPVTKIIIIIIILHRLPNTLHNRLTLDPRRLGRRDLTRLRARREGVRLAIVLWRDDVAVKRIQETHRFKLWGWIKVRFRSDG